MTKKEKIEILRQAHIILRDYAFDADQSDQVLMYRCSQASLDLMQLRRDLWRRKG